jgi:cytochrome b subunit of formate dehydrogenase
LTGPVIWKPIQFSGLVTLFVGFQSARVFDFAGVVIIVGFVLVHVLLALLVPKTISAMLAAGSRLKAQGSRLKAQGSRLKAQGSRLKAQGSRLKAMSENRTARKS